MYHLNISGPSSRPGSHAGRYGGVGAASANLPLLFEKILLNLENLRESASKILFWKWNGFIL
jgi:hypothetical protein